MADDPEATHTPISGLTPPLESTFDLLERTKRGDREAADRLFDRLRAPLRRWASGRLPAWARDLMNTEDLVQESLLQTFKRIGDFEHRGVGALQAYLRQVVLNRLRDELRRARRRPRIEDIDDVTLVAQGSPLEDVIGLEAIVRYETALAALKPGEREAVVARLELGCDYRELAEALGKATPEAARKAAKRAVVRLAEEMRRGGKPTHR